MKPKNQIQIKPPIIKDMIAEIRAPARKPSTKVPLLYSRDGLTTMPIMATQPDAHSNDGFWMGTHSTEGVAWVLHGLIAERLCHYRDI